MSDCAMILRKRSANPKVPLSSQRSSARIRRLQDNSLEDHNNSDSGLDLGGKRKSQSKSVQVKANTEPRPKRSAKKVQPKSQENAEIKKKAANKKYKKPMHRKRESEKNYEDNLMDSTPLKNRKKFKVPMLALDSDSEDDNLDSHEPTTKQMKEKCSKPTTGLIDSSKRIPDPMSSGKKVQFESKIPENKETKKCPVTAGVGTLKRKKQIREYLENLDHGYEDNIWDSTPFRERKRIKLPDVLSESDDEYMGYSVPNTPLCKTPINQYRPCGPLGADITPIGDFASPGILEEQNRKDMDYYVWKTQQRRKHGKYKIGTDNTTHKMKTKCVSSTYQAEIATPTNLQELLKADRPADLFIDSDEGEDDYDMDDP